MTYIFIRDPPLAKTSWIPWPNLISVWCNLSVTREVQLSASSPFKKKKKSLERKKIEKKKKKKKKKKTGTPSERATNPSLCNSVIQTFFFFIISLYGMLLYPLWYSYKPCESKKKKKWKNRCTPQWTLRGLEETPPRISRRRITIEQRRMHFMPRRTRNLFFFFFFFCNGTSHADMEPFFLGGGGKVNLPETVPCFYRGHCKKKKKFFF